MGGGGDVGGQAAQDPGTAAGDRCAGSGLVGGGGDGNTHTHTHTRRGVIGSFPRSGAGALGDGPEWHPPHGHTRGCVPTTTKRSCRGRGKCFAPRVSELMFIYSAAFLQCCAYPADGCAGEALGCSAPQFSGPGYTLR